MSQKKTQPLAKTSKPNSQLLQRQKRREFVQPTEPVLRFLPTAWAKLLFFRDRGDTEIGGFGITKADDLLYVEDFVTVKQEATGASISFDDEAVADLFDNQVDAGRKPEQFARIWLHTHPGNSAQQSLVDEETFQRVFGNCQWALMFVLALGGKSYARLRFNVGPGGSVVIPVMVDYSQPFGPSDHEAWEAEYQANIKAESLFKSFGSQVDLGLDEDVSSYSVPNDWLEEFEDMEPAERQYVLDELAGRPDLWEESEVICEY
jgi:hypothetical protein